MNRFTYGIGSNEHVPRHQGGDSVHDQYDVHQVKSTTQSKYTLLLMIPNMNSHCIMRSHLKAFTVAILIQIINLCYTKC